MKKITFFSLLVFAVTSLFVACNSQPQLKNIRGIVKHYVQRDSTFVPDSNGLVLPDMVLAIDKDDSLVFSMKDARIQNGLSVPGDSAIVDYIEGKDGLRALVVTRIPSDINIIDTDTVKHAKDIKK